MSLIFKSVPTMKRLFLIGIISLMSIVANAQNSKKLFQTAENFFAIEQYNEAIPLLNQCIEKQYYQDGRTHFYLIHSYLRIGQVEKGLTVLQEAIKMYPEQDDFLFLLFTAYSMSNDMRGVEVGKKVLETRWADSPEEKRDVLYWIGEICFMNNQYKEAIPYLRQCLEIDQDYIHAINYLGASMYDEVCELYDKLANMTNSDTPEYKDIFSRLEKDSNEAFLLMERGFKSPSTDLSIKIALAERLTELCSIFNAPEYREKEAYYKKFVESGGNI